MTVLVGAVAMLVLGWLFGLPEATALGVAGLVVLVAAAVHVLVRGPGATVRRDARPGRLSVGQPCEIVLTSRNEGTRWSPVTMLTDEVGTHGVAQVLLAPLAPGARAGTTYSLPTGTRGLHRIGPLRRRVVGPFGLVRRESVSGSTTVVVVLPRVVPLAALPPAVGDEPEIGTHSMVASSTVDEEFTGLRSYVPGDDVRRIHWPSTARTGGVVVRQFEVPWQHRTTVLVDLRPSRHTAASFERMVTAAASVVALAAGSSELLRFATTREPDPSFVAAAEHLEPLLDRLAMIEPAAAGPDVDDDALLTTVEQLTRTATGRLVICTGALSPHEMDRLRTAASRAGSAVLVTTSSGDPDDAVRRHPDGPVELHWDGSSDLSELWRDAGERSRPRTGNDTR